MYILAFQVRDRESRLKAALKLGQSLLSLTRQWVFGEAEGRFERLEGCTQATRCANKRSLLHIAKIDREWMILHTKSM